MVGALGIEPSLRAPKARVLPVYDAPTIMLNPKAGVLPVYYTPLCFTFYPNTYFSYFLALSALKSRC